MLLALLINIILKKHDDDLYLLNLGEKEFSKDNEKAFKTDEKNTESPGVKVLGTCGEGAPESSQIPSPNIGSK